jgi:hypothetical protein
MALGTSENYEETVANREEIAGLRQDITGFPERHAQGRHGPPGAMKARLNEILNEILTTAGGFSPSSLAG